MVDEGEMKMEGYGMLFFVFVAQDCALAFSFVFFVIFATFRIFAFFFFRIWAKLLARLPETRKTV